jgi:glycosyltransferase involved in cell wall biosynthesis
VVNLIGRRMYHGDPVRLPHRRSGVDTLVCSSPFMSESSLSTSRSLDDPRKRQIDALSLSVVVPMFNEEDCAEAFHARLATVLEQFGERAEVIYVDDGCSDRTVEILTSLAALDHRINVLRLSRNFGHQVAVAAGMELANGQAVVVIDADLQDPPEVILELIAAWRGGAQIVHAVRAERQGESWFKKTSAQIFYRLISRWADLDLQVDAGDFRLYDRVVVDVLNEMPERSRFVRGLASWVGFDQAVVSYTRETRHAGESKYPLRKMVRLATDALTGFSLVPLRFASLIGFMMSATAFLAIPVIIVLRAFGVAGLAGQTSVIIVVLVVGGIQMLFLGILGEYLGRISLESKRRPLYIVQPKGTVVAELDDSDGVSGR